MWSNKNIKSPVLRTYSLSVFRGMFLGTLRSPWPWQSTVVPVQEHWAGQGWLSAPLDRTKTNTITSSPGTVIEERLGPTGHKAPTITVASRGPIWDPQNTRALKNKASESPRELSKLCTQRDAVLLFVVLPLLMRVSQTSRYRFTFGSS